MASKSFAFPNQFTDRRCSVISPPSLRRPFRVSAELGTQITSKTASYYDVLGVGTGATVPEIKSAYRKLARVLHPDVASDEDASSAEEFMRVHAAYSTLSDPEKRAMYDNSLFRRRRRPAVTLATCNSGMTRPGRSWETDQCW